MTRYAIAAIVSGYLTFLSLVRPKRAKRLRLSDPRFCAAGQSAALWGRAIMRPSGRPPKMWTWKWGISWPPSRPWLASTR